MEELDAIWAAAKENIRPQMTALSYHAWIDVIEPLTVQNGILILVAPDADIRNTLRDFYYEALHDAVHKASGNIVDVKLVLPEERSQYAPKATQNTIDVFALNPKYQFNSFVVGSGNQFAHAAALAVAEKPAEAYNPLFIYGGVGLGKTHLMHAIGHSVRQNYAGARVMYVTSENFTNDLIDAIQNDQRMEFRRRYRNVDVLLIDDVQFIAKKQSVQEEFFNTFNTLHNANKQIVISSDRPPKEIASLEERLRSRFEWGLIADIQPPDVETRIAILLRRAELDHISVNRDVIMFIAEHVSSNVRELEGCLTRVVAYAQLERRPLNLEVTREALKDLLPDVKKPKLTPQLIKTTVAESFGVTEQSMLSERRDREIVLPRQIAMYLCHTMLGLPYKRISALFERNDHTTAINACRRVDEMILDSSTNMAPIIEDLKKRLSE